MKPKDFSGSQTRWPSQCHLRHIGFGIGLKHISPVIIHQNQPQNILLYSQCSNNKKNPVMLSPRGQNFGLGLEALASDSNIWPRPGLDLVVLLCNRAFFGQKSCTNTAIMLIFPAMILNCMLLIIVWYFFIIIFGLGLGLNFQKLASASQVLPQPRPRRFGLV